MTDDENAPYYNDRDQWEWDTPADDAQYLADRADEDRSVRIAWAFIAVIVALVIYGVLK